MTDASTLPLPASGFLASGRVSGFLILVRRFDIRVSGFGLSGFGSGAWGFGFWNSGLGFRVVRFGFRVSRFGFRVSGFDFHVSGFGFRISGFEFRVSVFGLGVSGFGCRTPRVRRAPEPPHICCRFRLAPPCRPPPRTHAVVWESIQASGFKSSVHASTAGRLNADRLLLNNRVFKKGLRLNT